MRQGQQGVAAHAVDLVQRQDDLFSRRLQIGDDGFGILGRAPIRCLTVLAFGRYMRGRVDQMDDHIGVVRPAPGRGDHSPVQPAAGREDARGIDQNDLGVALDSDPAHRKARRLNLLGDDRDLGPGQPIDQGGLAGIGRADDGGKACAGGHADVLGIGQMTPSRCNRPMAAVFSAS